MNGAVVLAAAGLRGRRRVAVAATTAVLALASVAIAAGLAVSSQGAPLLDRVAGQADVAHLVLYGDADALRRVASDPEVVAWSGPFATVGGADLVAGDVGVGMQLTALDDPDVAVERAPVQSGRWVRNEGEIVLDRSLASDLGIATGDQVALQYDGATTTYDVVGTAISFTDCFYPQCDPGRAWLTGGGLARIGAGDDTYWQAWLRFRDASEADPFVDRQLAGGVAGITGSDSWLDTREDFLTLDRVFGSFVAAFGVFVLAVATVVIAGSTAVRIVARRREIGLLGAVGCTPRQVVAGLVLENVVLGLIGAVVGWMLAGFLTPSLQLGIGRTLGTQDPSWPVGGLVAATAAITILLIIATVVPAVSAARRPVTEVLRDAPLERVSRLNRWARDLPRRLPLLGARETASQPTRAALTGLAIVVAVVGTMVSIGFISGIHRVAGDPARAGDPWQVALAPDDVPQARVEAALAAEPRVGSWFSDLEWRSTYANGAFLSVATAGDPAAADYRIAGGRAMRTAGEAIAGYGFLQRFDVSVGDTIEIHIGTTPLTLHVVGWYRDTEDSGEVLRYRFETLAAADPGVQPGVYRITAAPGVTPAALAASLGATFGPSAHISVMDTGIDDLAPLMAVLWLIAAVLLAMAATNVLTTLLTANREASRQIGVQMAVGFTPRQLVVQGAVSGAALGLMSMIVAVPTGLLVFRVLSDVVSSGMGVGPRWMPAPPALAVSIVCLATCVVSAGLGAMAASRVARRPAADLVRAE